MTIFRALYVSTRVWLLLIAFVLLFILAYVFPVLFPFVKLLLAVLVALCLLDGILLFRNPTKRAAFFARRELPDRLSNGDENPVTIYLENRTLSTQRAASSVESRSLVWPTNCGSRMKIDRSAQPPVRRSSRVMCSALRFFTRSP